MAHLVSAQHIAPQSGGFEPQRTYDFILELYNLAGHDTVELAVKSAFFPNGQSGVIELRYFAESRKVAGPITFPNGTITCYDYVDENIAGLLLAWRNLVHDIETGAQGYASEYKSEGSILLVDPKGDKDRVFSLHGVWPASVSGNNLDYESSDKFEVTMDLVFDTAVPQFVAKTP